MAEELIIKGETKEDRYRELLPQLEALMAAESDPVARMANAAAALKETFGWLWVGFYRVVADRLVLGPFQGPLACMSIRKGRGVCGTAWAEERTIVVDDVDTFPGHIACSSASRSEIVVPMMRCGACVGVLDIDSEKLSTFDETDACWLRRVADLITSSVSDPDV